MEIKKDNPAGRLYEILAKAKNQPPDNALKTVLTAALNASNDVDFYKRLVHLKELVNEVKETVQNMENINKELYLSHYPQIEQLTQTSNLDIPWKNVIHLLGEPALINVAHIAEILPYNCRENLIEENVLNELIFEIEEVIKKVNDSSLIIELKRLIIDQLYIILNSIYSYKIRGVKGLRNALTTSLGEFIINYKLFKDAENTDEVKSFKSILFKTHSIVTSAFTYYQIAQEGVRFLLGS